MNARPATILRITFVVVDPTCPPRDGVSVFIQNIISGLVARGHRIQMLAIRHTDSAGDMREWYTASQVLEMRIPPPPKSVLAAIVRRVGSLFQAMPPWLWEYRSQAIRRWVYESVKASDAQVVVGMGDATGPAILGLEIPSLWFKFGLLNDDLLNDDAKILPTSRAARLVPYRFESNWPAKFDAVGVTTLRECQILQTICPSAKAMWLPFGIALKSLDSPVQICGRGFELLFVGDWNYPPNVDGVQALMSEVMPRVWSSIPEARLILAGKCSEKIKHLERDSRVTVYGEYTKLEDLVAENRVAILPLRRTSGFRTRVFELLAANLPLVATRATTQGLDLRPGECILTNDWQEFSSECVKILMSPPIRAELRRGGTRFLQRVGDLSEAVKVWENALLAIEGSSKWNG